MFARCTIARRGAFGPPARRVEENMPSWVTIHLASSPAEAEILRSLLRQADIPTLKKPDNLSAYLPSPFLEIVVPEAQSDEAREIVTQLLSHPGEEGP